MRRTTLAPICDRIPASTVSNRRSTGSAASRGWLGENGRRCGVSGAMEWLLADGYWLSRLVFQRALALVYLIAFLNAANQFRALAGERGLLPVPRFVRRTSFRQAPSLFRLYYSDRAFTVAAWTGVSVSAALLAGLGDRLPLPAHMAAWALLWVRSEEH